MIKTLFSILRRRPPLVVPLDPKVLFCVGCSSLIHRRTLSTESKPGKEVIRSDSFQDIQVKTRQSYLEMVQIYKDKEILRRGHVEFIYAALKYMKEFGVEKDLAVYKSLIDVMPKGKMVPRNIFQAEFMHYPKQQQCMIDLLEQMEENGVIPDWEMEDQLINVFGRRGYPVRRYWRMMYWMPKFKNASPWPLPNPVPSDSLELAKMAIERITSVDVNTEITVYKTSDVEDSIEDTWIVSGQSSEQKEILLKLAPNTPIYVEGGFRIWLRDKAVTYYILRTIPLSSKEPVEENFDDVKNIQNPFLDGGSKLMKRKSVHDQTDGTILAVCATGSSSQDSLLSWVRSLEKTNPRLSEGPVLFSIKTNFKEPSPPPQSSIQAPKPSLQSGPDSPPV